MIVQKRSISSFSTSLLFILLLISSSVGSAQTKNENTLLWRISGKNGKQLSYLFGTMHLTDKRLFNFSDSIYSALEKSAGFAMEVNPDEAAAYYVNKMFDQMEKGKKLKDVVSEKAFSKYEKSLSKKFGKDAKDITTSDVLREKNKWMAEYIQKGEMPTILDAYLYNIAKRQAKWVGGIEDLSDQTGLIDDLVDQSDLDYIFAGEHAGNDSSLEKMISMYAKQDIYALEQISSGFGRADIRMIKRNVKMARRMDSLSAIRSMFFAVGAAHLAGDSGLISLLRNAGYNVSPVFSGKKIDPGAYTYKEIPLQWNTIKDKQGLYEVSMPGHPSSVKIHGLMDMEFLLDLTSFSSYATMAVISPVEYANKDSMLNEVAKKMFKTKKPVIGKDILVNGIAGKEYIQKIDNATARVQLLLQNRVLYMVMISALKKENLASADAERYLSSFTITTPPDKHDIPNRFTDTVRGISFLSPVPISVNDKLTKQLSDKSWDIKSYSGVDAKNGAYIMFFSKQPVAGSYFNSDIEVLNEIRNGLDGQYIDISSEITSLQGYKTLTVKARQSVQPNFHVRFQTVVRGNQLFSLMAIGDSSIINSAVYNQLYQSVNFLPVARANWKKEISDKWHFSARVPSPYQPLATEEEAEDRTISFDYGSSTSYSFIIDTLHPFRWAVSDTAFLEKSVRDYLKTDDSSISKTISRKNNQLTVEQFLMRKNSFTAVRVKGILHGNLLYIIYASGDKALLESVDTDSLYAGFSLTGKPAPFDVSASKTALLMKDLEGSDSSKRVIAYTSLEKENIGQKDIGQLHTGLFQQFGPVYKWDSDSMYINDKIAGILEDFADPSTIQFIESNYTQLKAKPSYQAMAINLLAGIHTHDSYESMLKLLQSARLQKKLPYEFNGKLTDSLALSYSFFPQLSAFIRDTILGPQLTNLTIDLLDSSYLKLENIRANENDFIGLASLALPGIKHLKDYEVDYNLELLLKLLERFNSPASLKAISQYLSITDKSMLQEAALIMIRKKQSVSAGVLKNIAAGPVFRTSFYNELKKLKKQHLFPTAYLTQKYFSESAIYQIASNDEEPASVKLLSQKTGTVAGKKYLFYLYKVSYGEGDDQYSYLGITGGYDPAGKKLDPVKDFSGLYTKEEFDAKHVNEQFRSFLELNELPEEEE